MHKHNIFYIINLSFFIFIIFYTFKPSINANIDALEHRDNYEDVLLPMYDLELINYGIIKNYRINFENLNFQYDNLKIAINGGSLYKLKSGNWFYSNIYENFHSTKLFRYVPLLKKYHNLDFEKSHSIDFSINHISLSDDMNFSVTLSFDHIIYNLNDNQISFFDLDNKKNLLPSEIIVLENKVILKFENTLIDSNYFYFFLILIIIFLPWSILFLIQIFKNKKLIFKILK